MYWEWSWWCVVAKISFCTQSFLVVLVIHQASGLFKSWSSPQRTAISICRKVHNVKCNSSILKLRYLRCSRECYLSCCGTSWSVKPLSKMCDLIRLLVGLRDANGDAIRAPSQLFPQNHASCSVQCSFSWWMLVSKHWWTPRKRGQWLKRCSVALRKNILPLGTGETLSS